MCFYRKAIQNISFFANLKQIGKTSSKLPRCYFPLPVISSAIFLLLLIKFLVMLTFVQAGVVVGKGMNSISSPEGFGIFIEVIK